MTTTNADLAIRACELAEISEGLQRMAALCVSAAAATTSTFRNAHGAMEVIAHPGLRAAARQLLAELAAQPTAEVTAVAPGRAS